MRTVVVKVGGGLIAVAGALNSVAAALRAGRGQCRLVVVPGGGPFADAVRSFDREQGLSADAAHWMAILAMDQYAHALADRIEGAELVEHPAGVAQTLEAGRIAVLAPSHWMRAADVLPHSWEATSDSVAAFVAGALDAAELILVKPGEGGPEAVDGCFRLVVPADLPVRVVSWDGLAVALRATPPPPTGPVSQTDSRSVGRPGTPRTPPRGSAG